MLCLSACVFMYLCACVFVTHVCVCVCLCVCVCALRAFVHACTVHECVCAYLGSLHGSRGPCLAPVKSLQQCLSGAQQKAWKRVYSCVVNTPVKYLCNMHTTWSQS